MRYTVFLLSFKNDGKLYSNYPYGCHWNSKIFLVVKGIRSAEGGNYILIAAIIKAGLFRSFSFACAWEMFATNVCCNGRKGKSII